MEHGGSKPSGCFSQHCERAQCAFEGLEVDVWKKLPVMMCVHDVPASVPRSVRLTKSMWGDWKWKRKMNVDTDPPHKDPFIKQFNTLLIPMGHFMMWTAGSKGEGLAGVGGGGAQVTRSSWRDRFLVFKQRAFISDNLLLLPFATITAPRHGRHSVYANCADHLLGAMNSKCISAPRTALQYDWLGAFNRRVDSASALFCTLNYNILIVTIIQTIFRGSARWWWCSSSLLGRHRLPIQTLWTQINLPFSLAASE